MVQSIYKSTLFFGLVFLSSLLSDPIKVNGVDEVIHKGTTVHLFKYSNWTRQSLEVRSQKNGASIVVETGWKKLVKPDFKFSPRQVLVGQSNNFLVLEDGGERIWQFDSAFQTLSSITLPEEFKGAKLEGFRLIYSRDQKFNFIHSERGSVLQFIESGGKLRLHRKIKISVAAGQCVSVDWEYKNSLSINPFLCIAKDKLKLYTLFFTEGSSLSVGKYKSVSKDNDWNFMRPEVVFKKKSGPVLLYRLRDQFFCYSSELSEFYSCSYH